MVRDGYKMSDTEERITLNLKIAGGVCYQYVSLLRKRSSRLFFDRMVPE